MIRTIIPDEKGFVQVGINSMASFGKDVPLIYVTQSPVYLQAKYLQRLGLNVFPLPLGQKAGYPWRRLQYTRTHYRLTNHFVDLFLGSSNLGIMCGATSHNLFVIDCETIDSFAYHAREVRRRGIPLWAVTTGRGGHIYLFMEEGQVDNVPSGILQDAEIRGSHGYVVGPGSLHPSGLLYRWYARESIDLPKVSRHQIDWLYHKDDGYLIRLKINQRTPALRSCHRMKLRSPQSNLSKETLDYISNGGFTPVGSRNRRLFKAACDLCGNGFTYQEACDKLTTPASLSGLNSKEIIRTLESAYSIARTPSRPAFGIKSKSYDWQYAMHHVINLDYNGRTSGTLRSLYLAMVERSRVGSNKDGVFRASYRELAQLARIGLATLQRHLKSLMKDAATRPFYKVGVDRMSHSTLWRWSDSFLQRGKEIQQALDEKDGSPPAYWLTFSDALFDTDATERGALGKGAMFLYQYMRHNTTPLMPSRLAELSGLTISQTNYALRKMRDFGLLERLPNGWRVLPKTMEEVNRIAWDLKPKYTSRYRSRLTRFMKERESYAYMPIIKTRAKREGEAYLNGYQVPHYQWDAFVRLHEDVPYNIILQAGGILVEDPYDRRVAWINMDISDPPRS